MRIKTGSFEIEIVRCNLTALVRVGREWLDAFVSLDEPGLSTVSWRGKEYLAVDGPTPRPLTRWELEQRPWDRLGD